MPAQESLTKFVDHLAGRWEDEKGHEDFNDYAAAAQTKCEELGYTFGSLSKRPFRLSARYGDKVFHFVAKKNTVDVISETVETNPTSTADAAVPSREVLESLSLTSLAVVYNTYAETKVKKFGCSRAEAVAKVLSVLPTPPEPTAAPKAPRGNGIGAKTVEMLKAGKTIAEVVEALGTTANAVYWYASKIKRGLI